MAKKKAPGTWRDHFLELGKVLARTIGDRVGKGGDLYYPREIEVNPYLKPTYGHLFEHDELIRLWTYIVWTTQPPRRGALELLPSEKLRRARADYEAFERKKAEFAAANEKAPRKKAIEYLMKAWHAKDKSTVEKRVAKWKKTPEGIKEDLLTRHLASFKKRKIPESKEDDDIPF